MHFKQLTTLYYILYHKSVHYTIIIPPSLPLLNKNIFKKSLILSYLGFIFLFFYDILFMSVYKAIRGDNYVY